MRCERLKLMVALFSVAMLSFSLLVVFLTFTFLKKWAAARGIIPPLGSEKSQLVDNALTVAVGMFLFIGADRITAYLIFSGPSTFNNIKDIAQINSLLFFGGLAFALFGAFRILMLLSGRDRTAENAALASGSNAMQLPANRQALGGRPDLVYRGFVVPCCGNGYKVNGVLFGATEFVIEHIDRCIKNGEPVVIGDLTKSG